MTGRATLRALAPVLPGLLVLVAGTPCRGEMNAYGTAATVNGVGISNETLERVSSMRREVLDLLIDQELAWQAAQKARDAVQAELQRLRSAANIEVHLPL
jgi:hypothetical protein